MRPVTCLLLLAAAVACGAVDFASAPRTPDTSRSAPDTTRPTSSVALLSLSGHTSQAYAGARLHLALHAYDAAGIPVDAAGVELSSSNSDVATFGRVQSIAMNDSRGVRASFLYLDVDLSAPGDDDAQRTAGPPRREPGALRQGAPAAR